MAEEKSRKTLANCTAVEGFKQLNAVRKEFSEFYKLIDVDSIRKRYAEQEGEPDALARSFMDDLLTAALDVNAEKAVALVGMLAFMSKEESAGLSMDEAYGILTDCMKSQAVMDFFSSAVRSVMKGMENT